MATMIAMVAISGWFTNGVMLRAKRVSPPKNEMPLTKPGIPSSQFMVFTTSTIHRMVNSEEKTSRVWLKEPAAIWI